MGSPVIASFMRIETGHDLDMIRDIVTVSAAAGHFTDRCEAADTIRSVGMVPTDERVDYALGLRAERPADEGE